MVPVAASGPLASFNVSRRVCSPAASEPFHVPSSSLVMAVLLAGAVKTASPLRVILNGIDPPPCEKSPLIVAPSAARVPLKVGVPGTLAMTNDTDVPCTSIDDSGNAFRFWAGIEMVPTHAGGVPGLRSTSTSSGWAGVSSTPVQCPDALGVCADTAGAATRPPSNTTTTGANRTADTIDIRFLMIPTLLARAARPAPATCGG